MILGVPTESADGEKRVALVPESVPKLKGIESQIQKGAGEPSGFSDAQYEEKGAKIVDDPWGAEMIVKVRGPSLDEIGRLKEGQVLAALLNPFSALDEVRALAEKKVTSFSLEFIPRITRAQSMDVLSSMSNLAGYKAVVMAAERLPKYFPMLMTAAGTIPPAKVFIIGAGVAGLQAIATARRLGAVVEAFDTRPVVKEQVQSLGARFFEIDLGAEDAEDKGGYAKQLTKEQLEKQQHEMGERLKQMDVVITTALVPGRPAPKLISADVVKGMRKGSVIVDLAAETGGNCELTERDQIVEKEGVTICGLVNLPSTMANHASMLFSRNIATFLNLLAKEGELKLDMEDEIIKGAVMTHEGAVKNERISERLSK